MDLVAGQPTGCVRVSLGFASTALDVVSVARFVETCFVQGRRPRDVTREYEELTATIKEEEVSEEHARGEEEPQELSEEVADTAETQADQEHIPDLGTHASGEGSEVAGERCPGPRENHVCDGMYHRIQGEDEAAGTEADVQEKDTIQLEKIYVYPVKSCAGFEVSCEKLCIIFVLTLRARLVTQHVTRPETTRKDESPSIHTCCVKGSVTRAVWSTWFV